MQRHRVARPLRVWVIHRPPAHRVNRLENKKFHFHQLQRHLWARKQQRSSRKGHLVQRVTRVKKVLAVICCLPIENSSIFSRWFSSIQIEKSFVVNCVPHASAPSTWKSWRPNQIRWTRSKAPVAGRSICTPTTSSCFPSFNGRCITIVSTSSQKLNMARLWCSRWSRTKHCRLADTCSMEPVCFSRINWTIRTSQSWWRCRITMVSRFKSPSNWSASFRKTKANFCKYWTSSWSTRWTRWSWRKWAAIISIQPPRLVLGDLIETLAPANVECLLFHFQIRVQNHGIELWPGYTTSIRQHEQDILMLAEIKHKLVRSESILDILNKTFFNNKTNFKNDFENIVMGMTVLTKYNNKTYRISEVNFELTPRSTFEGKNGEQICYMNYYKTVSVVVVCQGAKSGLMYPLVFRNTTCTFPMTVNHCWFANRKTRTCVVAETRRLLWFPNCAWPPATRMRWSPISSKCRLCSFSEWTEFWRYLSLTNAVWWETSLSTHASNRPPESKSCSHSIAASSRRRKVWSNCTTGTWIWRTVCWNSRAVPCPLKK